MKMLSPNSLINFQRIFEMQCEKCQKEVGNLIYKLDAQFDVTLVCVDCWANEFDKVKVKYEHIT